MSLTGRDRWRKTRLLDAGSLEFQCFVIKATVVTSSPVVAVVVVVLIVIIVIVITINILFSKNSPLAQHTKQPLSNSLFLVVEAAAEGVCSIEEKTVVSRPLERFGHSCGSWCDSRRDQPEKYFLLSKVFFPCIVVR